MSGVHKRQNKNMFLKLLNSPTDLTEIIADIFTSNHMMAEFILTSHTFKIMGHKTDDVIRFIT